MGIFSSIKNAIFGEDKDEPTPAPKSPTTTPAASPKRAPISSVDVEKRLSNMSGAEKLNWRTSIVDLMKLVGIDPSYENRKELAHELGNTDYSGTAEDNIALHKAVMNKIAASGGIVPKELKD
ncbi:DUF3597 domain-containing protein [Erythrobacter sp. MTPC3]|uniref:DUF3597 domain-containing protein n=1 Tax=Erythrobacter sp. MTPC3 TaxID=3056564 RepID=UPI0036F1FC6D